MRFELTSVYVDDQGKALAATFVQPPTAARPVIQAVFNDTCGNLVQIYQVLATAA